MALTFTRIADGEDVWGRTKVKYLDITLDSSYPASAGYVINAQDVGLKYIRGAQVVGGNQASGTLLYAFDNGTTAGVLKTSTILRCYQPTGGGGTNPTTLAAPIVSSGVATASAVDATTPTIVPGIGKEVANTASLTAYIVRVRFEGQ